MKVQLCLLLGEGTYNFCPIILSWSPMDRIFSTLIHSGFKCEPCASGPTFHKYVVDSGDSEVKLSGSRLRQR